MAENTNTSGPLKAGVTQEQALYAPKIAERQSSVVLAGEAVQKAKERLEKENLPAEKIPYERKVGNTV